MGIPLPHSKPKNGNFLQPLAVNLKLVAMLSWGFPSMHVHVELPFFSVLQLLFIILRSKPSYLHREVYEESLSNLEGTDPPQPKNGNFLHPPAVKLKLVAILLWHYGDSPQHMYM